MKDQRGKIEVISADWLNRKDIVVSWLAEYKRSVILIGWTEKKSKSDWPDRNEV